MNSRRGCGTVEIESEGLCRFENPRPRARTWGTRIGGGLRFEPSALALCPHKLAYQRRDLICFGVEREVSCVEDVDLRRRYVLSVAFRFAWIERQIVLAPDGPEALAASSSSMPATLDKHRRWCGSRRRGMRHLVRLLYPALCRAGQHTSACGRRLGASR